MYTTRVLPPAEWPRLAGTEAEPLWPHLRPSDARVLVVEHGTEILGVWVLFRAVHAECVWVAPDHRGKGSVVRRLVQFMGEQARKWGYRTVVAGTTQPAVEVLLKKLHGVPVPGALYALPVWREGDTAWDGQ